MGASPARSTSWRSIFDTPPVTPPAPWNLARLAPASVWWDLMSSSGAVVDAAVTASFDIGLPFDNLYSWYYAPGTYQNKPNRPGQYLFELAHSLDTAHFPNGTYTLQVMAADTRNNVGDRVAAADVREQSLVTGHAGAIAEAFDLRDCGRL